MVTGRYPGLTLLRVPGHEVVGRIPRIWAVGDVKGGPAFTHISYDDYPIVAGNLLEGKNLGTDGRVVPSVSTDPQLGRVGLTDREASQRPITVGTIPMTGSRAPSSEMGY
jgi:pyruvate/2-oxoglutarate dehydrogenase complex dihydrolipoamide dehydrogenase (E3) component